MTAPVPEQPDGLRCADAAEAAGDRLEGTAPPADHWFLVEHPGPWNRFILAGPGFDARGRDRARPVGAGCERARAVHPQARASRAVGAAALVPGRRAAGARVRPRPGSSAPRPSWWTSSPIRARAWPTTAGSCWCAPTAGTTRAAPCGVGRWPPRWPRNCRSARGSPATSAGAGSPQRWCCCRTGSSWGTSPRPTVRGSPPATRRGCYRSAGCGAGRRCRRRCRPRSTMPGSRPGRSRWTRCGPSRRRTGVRAHGSSGSPTRTCGSSCESGASPPTGR